MITTAPKVWIVREEVRRADSSGRSDLMDIYILATSASEAAEIVGETEYRQIKHIQEVCSITILPDAKYKIIPIGP